MIKKVEELSEGASPVINRFYTFLQQKNFDSTIIFFTDKCFSQVPADSLVAMLQTMNHDRGDIRSFSLEENKYLTSTDGGITKKELIQKYRVEYSSGFVTSEEFTFLENDLLKKNNKVINSYVIDFYTVNE